MEKIILQRTNEPNLCFFGELLANDVDDYARDRHARWLELHLYKTKSGFYICKKSYLTRQQGESDEHKVKICGNQEEVKAFFGYSDMAKEVYKDSGIDFTENFE